MSYFTSKCLLILSVLLSTSIMGHGFGYQTGVHLDNNSSKNIHSVCLKTLRNKVSVASYDLNNSRSINRSIITAKQSTTNCYIRLCFDSQPTHDILCTPTQEFYMPTSHTWIPAYKIKAGDKLLTKHMTMISIDHKEFIPHDLTIYMLEIENSHVFFVGA